MVKPPLFGQPDGDISEPDGERVFASLTLILLLPPSTCGHPTGAKLENLFAAFWDTSLFIPVSKPFLPNLGRLN